MLHLHWIVQILDGYAPLIGISSTWSRRHDDTIVDKTNATRRLTPVGQGNGQDLALLYHRSGEERLISFLCEICMEMKFPEDGSLHAHSNPWHFSFLLSLFFFFFSSFPFLSRRARCGKINAYYLSLSPREFLLAVYTHAYTRLSQLFEYELPLTDYGSRMSTGLCSSPTCISGWYIYIYISCRDAGNYT